MRRDRERLVIPLSGGPWERRLGWFLLGASVLLAYGGFRVREPGHSYRLGHTGPAASWLLAIFAWALASFVLLGGLFQLCSRSGITLDRRSRTVTVWERWLPGGRWESLRRYDLTAFRSVELSRAVHRNRLADSTYEIFELWLTDAAGGALCLQPRLLGAMEARARAGRIGDFLGLPVDDRSGEDRPVAPYPSHGGPAGGAYRSGPA